VGDRIVEIASISAEGPALQTLESHENADARRELAALRERNAQLEQQLACARACGGIAEPGPRPDRRAAFEPLRETEYRRIVESTRDGIWIYDTELVTTFMNARMASMLGYTVEEATGRHIFEFMYESQHRLAHERVERRRQGIAECGELTYRCRDGSTLWTSYQATPLMDAGGDLEAVLVVVTDASSQRRADETRARLAAIVESSEDAVMSVSLEGFITSWNLGAEKLCQLLRRSVVDGSLGVFGPAE
jgi:PAS domain S-box-containing protein